MQLLGNKEQGVAGATSRGLGFRAEGQGGPYPGGPLFPSKRARKWGSLDKSWPGPCFGPKEQFS